jgi:hypothetical protein
MVDTEPKIIPVMVPDIGDFDEVEVIEVLVNAGDELSAEDSIITLESDKASMEIPTPVDHHRYDFWFSINHFCDYFFTASSAFNIKNQITQFNFVT